MKFPIIPCDFCSSQEHLQRCQIKDILNNWEVRWPRRRQIMFNSLMNIRPSHFLGRNMFDFDTFSRDADNNAWR